MQKKIAAYFVASNKRSRLCIGRYQGDVTFDLMAQIAATKVKNTNEGMMAQPLRTEIGKDGMKRQSQWLLDFKKDIYSQTGEDGVIEKILQILPRNDKWCVEFGAWDGLYLSNTRNLIESHDYSAILIEANKSKFRELQNTYLYQENVITINTRVGLRKDDGLDTILNNLPLPKDFDFLSIDIDGNDYHTWKAISEFRPKIVCIEFNPTIPTQMRFVQPADSSMNQGASLLSLVELGKEKGYELISVLSWNAFFVDMEYYPLFEIEDNSPEVLRTNLDFITYLFSGYDGTIYLCGNKQLLWHNIELKESRLQYFPGFLRKLPGNYNSVELAMFRLFRWLSLPR